MVRPRIHLALIAAVAVTAAGCEGSSESSISLLSPEPPTEPVTVSAVTSAPTTTSSTTTQPITTTTVASPAPPWLPATANLEGLPSECGNMHFVAARTDRDMVIAGIALQGLFAQFDGTGEWIALGTGEGSATIPHRLTSVVFDPEDPERFWESGIYGGTGIYRTDDNGSTFQQLGDLDGSDLVSVDFMDPDRRTLLAGSHERPFVFRSVDGGNTWQDLSASLPEGIGYASSPHVIDAQTYLLGTNTGPSSGVYRTTDAGESWSLVWPGGIFGAPLVVGETIYWLTESGGVISSTDGGESWSQPDGGNAAVRYGPSLVGLPDGRIVTIAQRQLIVSADGGETWSALGGSPLPYDPVGLTYSPASASFYVWRFGCDFSTDNPIPADAIMRLDGVVEN